MKVSRFSSLWRMQLLKLGRGIGSSRPAVKLGGVESRASVGCFRGSHLLKQLIRKLRSQCKKALGRRKSYGQFSYDIHSYALNFDNGFNDQVSRHSFQ